MTAAQDRQPVRGHLRRADWERISYGLFAPWVDPRPLADQLLAWSKVLPRHAAFTHLTAAALLGWWLPSPIVHPVFATLNTGDPRPRRDGLFVCRHPKPVSQVRHGDLWVTTPAETLLAAARDLGVLDLVIMGDSALREGHCTLAELRKVALQRRRGAPLLRTVIPLLDARSESAWESVMRVLHVAAEVDVLPQYEVRTPVGSFVCRSDLWLVGTRTIHEYDGAVHRDVEAQKNDLSRSRRITRADWQRVGFVSGDLLHGGAGIIADLDRLLERPWDSRRLAAWNALIDTSLYGRRGRARAYAQWRRSAAASPKVVTNRRFRAGEPAVCDHFGRKAG